MTAVTYPDSYHGGTWYRWEQHSRDEDSFHGPWITNLDDAPEALLQAKATGVKTDEVPWSLVKYESQIQVTIERAE